MLYDLEKEDLISIIKNSDYGDLEALAREIRDFLVEKVSKTGGHLASNLGIVETTIALHKVYDTAVDRVIFDVGHQSYVHKIITGRAGAFDTLRKYKGLSGFPKSRESIHDAYDTGHSSTSISAAMGYATARDLRNEDYQVVAVIGDGAMTGGLVYEALNNIGASGTNIKIVLNDNGMSIAKNVGAMSRHLNNLRTSKNYTRMKENIRGALDNIPVVGQRVSDTISHTKNKIKYSLLDEQGVLFEDLGIKYIGPVDGYDLPALVEAYTAANQYDGPTLVHVITKKGKGYYWSEKYPRKFHGIAPFDADNGNILSSPSGPSYSKVFGDKLVELARTDESIVAISAAMGTATGLGPFYKEFEPRFFDVGIAEAHAVVFAAGMAKAGMTPVVAIYSSFLQRAVDQILHDVCMQNLPVVFAVDRAGLVGSDGETHHGCFDLSYLSMMPNMTVMAPKNKWELSDMLKFAIRQKSPVAIRYPRGEAYIGLEDYRAPIEMGKAEILEKGKEIAILAVGNMVRTAVQVTENLRNCGYEPTLVNMRFVKPLDMDLLEILREDHSLIVTMEENVKSGGFGEQVMTYYGSRLHSPAVRIVAIEDQFVPHGSVEDLMHQQQMDSASVTERILRWKEEQQKSTEQLPE